MPICVREGMAIPRTRRFVPSDLALVKCFLRRKIANLPLPNDAIFEFDVYGTEPWNVPDVYGPGDKIDKEAPRFQLEPKKIVKEGYYFVRSCTKRKQKLPTVIKFGTGGGYWKKVNRGHRDVRDKKNKKLVGFKRTFVFHRFTDEKKTEKTDWILNEYSLNSKKFQPWVLCSVRNKLAYSKAYVTDDKDEEFLQQEEQVTKLVDGIEKIDIRNIENEGGTKQFLQQEELVTKLVDVFKEIDNRHIENAGGTKQFLQQEELVTKLVDGIKEIDICNIENAGSTKQFLQQEELVTKLVDGIKEIDICNIENAGGTKQFLQQDELVTKLVDVIKEIDIRNIENAGGTKQSENADNVP